MSELKPCPFCGGAVTMVLNGAEHSYFVYHKSFEPCLIGEPFEIPMNAVVRNFDDAVRAWNRRPNARNVGLWIRREKVRPNIPDDSDYEFECSCCGWRDLHNAKMIVPYCWHCGSKMEVSE